MTAGSSKVARCRSAASQSNRQTHPLRFTPRSPAPAARPASSAYSSTPTIPPRQDLRHSSQGARSHCIWSLLGCAKTPPLSERMESTGNCSASPINRGAFTVARPGRCGGNYQMRQTRQLVPAGSGFQDQPHTISWSGGVYRSARRSAHSEHRNRRLCRGRRLRNPLRETGFALPGVLPIECEALPMQAVPSPLCLDVKPPAPLRSASASAFPPPYAPRGSPLGHRDPRHLTTPDRVRLDLSLPVRSIRTLLILFRLARPPER